MTNLFTAAMLLGAVSNGMHCTDLRCEYRSNPLGIDVLKPRMSWVLESDRRGDKQTAYQIVVTDDERDLRAHHGNLWDSGRVSSDQSAQVVYNGRPLRSAQRAWWSVHVWDKDGRDCGWSKPASWEMGLLKPADWKAQWIGGASTTAASQAVETYSDVKWVWYPEGDPAQMAPKGDRYFRLSFDVPASKTVKTASLAGIADNSFRASVNGKRAGNGDGWQAWQSMDIAGSLKPGKNIVTFAAHNEDGPAGLAAILKIAYTDGTAQRYGTGPEWKVAREAAPGWTTAGFNDSAWKPAFVVAALGEGAWGKVGQAQSMPSPVPYLRKSFTARKAIKSARLYASALGLYQVHINGRRLGNDYFTPGWTDYHKRIQYQTYDITKMLKRGNNAVGIILGDGWYCGYVGFGGRRNHYGTKPYALAQIQLVYADGSSDTIATDSSWKTSTGPIQTSDMLMGETYDATREMPGWSEPVFDDSRWNRPELAPPTLPSSSSANAKPVSPTSLLVASCDQTVQQVDTVAAKTMTEKPAGAYIFDLGQNMVGWVRLKVKGARGTTVTLRFAEMLNKDGTVYTTNLRGARATDHYTLKGGSEEVYEPTFTFHGFRYVELTGLIGKPDLGDVTGIVVHTATPETGTFECSNRMVNQLQHNILWGMRGNYLEVPTDCPQRDERLGWMGDAQIFVRTGCYNMDISAFMTKWMNDVEDAQSPQGGFSDVSPRVVDPADGAPAWGDAGVIVPWTIYQCYGDTRIIEQHYDAMAKWIEYIHSANPNLIWHNRCNNNFGDWLSIAADTPRDVLATAYFAYDASLMAKMARAIGRTEDAAKYTALFDGIKAAFNREFVAPDGKIRGDTQTCYVIALRFGLLPEALRPVAAQRLASNIQARDWHLSTGFVGVGYLTPTLTDNGYLDVAYKLLNQDTFPSWGYSIKQGATTIWERWDGYTTDKGFQDPGMNSFNHYSLGSVGEWMYTDVGGIDLDAAQPGYKHIIMHPRPGGGLTYAKTSYDSLHGRIVSDWKQENGAFSYHVVIPANTSATVHVPAKSRAQVTEGGKSAVNAVGVRFLKMEDGCAVYEVGSGTYDFHAS